MTTAEVLELPVNERLRLIEEIWDSLCHEKAEIESPSWHQEILDKRMALIESGKAECISISDLHSRMHAT